MKRIVNFAITTLIVASGHTFAEGLTRAQVYEEMAQYKAAGFNPARQNPRTWVDDAQRASAQVTEAHTNDAQLHEASDSAASQH
jgi:hypothetical protein